MKSVTRKTALFLTLALSLATVGCGKDTPKVSLNLSRRADGIIKTLQTANWILPEITL